MPMVEKKGNERTPLSVGPLSPSTKTPAPKYVWGGHAVAEALRSPERVNRVYVAADHRVRQGELLLQQAKAANVPIEYVPSVKLTALVGTSAHQGVAAALSPIGYESVRTLLERAPSDAVLVALDGVVHPRNLGLIARAAYAAGAYALVIPSRGNVLVDDTVIQSSAGMALRLPIARCTNLTQCLRECKRAGFWVYGLTANAATSLYQATLAEKAVYVLGNETRGLSHSTEKSCDALLSIPLVREADSLNVALAAAVTLFEVHRRRLVAPS
jgi:23S rRNA (guanosine2251-2'-O)-methyltransferase